MKMKSFFYSLLLIFVVLISCKTETNIPIYYSVSFNSDGGTFVSAQIVEKGKKAKEPAVPSRDNYDFLGWYNDNSLFDFKTPIEKDITLTAHWKQQMKYYTVTYISAYGTVPAQLRVKENTALDETSLPILSDENQVFKGWFIGENKITPGQYYVTSDITLTAIWSDNVTISYFSLFGTTPIDVDKKVNSNVTQSILTPIKYDQYIFLG